MQRAWRRPEGVEEQTRGRCDCRRAGGDRSAAAASSAPAAPAAAASSAPAAPAAAKSSTASKSATTEAASNTDPTGATAKCKDGTYSKSQHHSGTCSSHGGVAEWLKAQ